MILKGEKKLIDVWHYFVGNYRYKLYYSEKPFIQSFMRYHIREQILWRIEFWMDKECYDKGQCIKCGCETTALQMCNKSCDKPCYPPIMSAKEWKEFKIRKMYQNKHGIFLVVTEYSMSMTNGGVETREKKLIKFYKN